jgi:hypothetical protein
MTCLAALEVKSTCSVDATYDEQHLNFKESDSKQIFTTRFIEKFVPT